MGLDLGWEVDLWGRVRRSMQAAKADVAATIEDWRDVLVTIRAEVAQSYISVRSFQLQIASLNSTIKTQAATLKLIQDQYDAGVTNDLYLAQAQASLAEIEAQLPSLVESLAESINRLSVLIGESPGPLRARLSVPEPVPQAPNEIGVGIPADLIRRRPDIRTAERTLAIYTAQVGVAEAALFPTLQITGTGGFSSTQFSQWFDSSSLGGLLGIQVTWPFFTAGRLQALVKVANEQTLQALYNYEQTVLTAIEEVENALIGYAQTLRERQQLRRVVVAYQRVVKLAKERYTSGADDLQTLLDAQRYLSQAEQTLAQVEGQVSANVVILYKALGGAWEVVPKGTSGAETVATEEHHESEQKQEVPG
jgi:NodT family efflux transporter outer membrane factor (OMF) lipoprotein